jgi:hypothetical protein
VVFSMVIQSRPLSTYYLLPLEERVFFHVDLVSFFWNPS